MKLFLPQAKRTLFTLRVLVFALGFIVAGVLYFCLRYLNAPINRLQPGTVFEVESGNALSQVANKLADRGVLLYPELFVTLARLRGVANSIQGGEYELHSGITPVQLLDKMVRGDNVQYRITLVEGWTFNQVLDEFKSSEKLTLKLLNTNRTEIASALGLESPNPEGMLFPDTYFYSKGTTDLELLRTANMRLREILSSAWSSRLGVLPYENAYQALTMASIIEKESALGSERGHIAGVFVRRLEQRMRLQSDPTVIYGIGESFNGDLRRADLRMENPYNTYSINGLPPTPIALAGLESIMASLNPLQSDYLYFVGKGDGSHHFSSTLEEHNVAVARYQKTR